MLIPPLPVKALAANLSPMFFSAPPPLGKESDGTSSPPPSALAEGADDAD